MKIEVFKRKGYTYQLDYTEMEYIINITSRRNRKYSFGYSGTGDFLFAIITKADGEVLENFIVDCGLGSKLGDFRKTIEKVPCHILKFLNIMQDYFE